MPLGSGDAPGVTQKTYDRHLQLVVLVYLQRIQRGETVHLRQRGLHQKSYGGQGGTQNQGGDGQQNGWQNTSAAGFQSITENCQWR